MSKRKRQLKPVKTVSNDPSVRQTHSLSPQLILILFILLGTVIYLPSFGVSFHFDDQRNFVQHSVFHNPFDVATIWKHGVRRFVPFWSLAWNYHFSKENVFSYHVVNLLIHLAASFVCFLFIRLTFQTPQMAASRGRPHADWIALFGGLIFLCHPVQTQAVTYIVQRQASMAALFYLATLYFVGKASLSKNRKFYAAAVITCFLSVFSKENTYTLPFAILFYYCFFFKIKKSELESHLFNFLFFLMPIGLIFVTGFKKVIAAKGLAGLAQATAKMPHHEYLLTQFNVIMTYLRLLFVPMNQMLDYDYPIAKTLFEFPTLASLLFLCALFYAGLRLFKTHRLISFGIFFFFLTLSIESGLINITDVIFEHRVYLPMAGFAMALSCGTYVLVPNKKFLILGASALIVAFSVLTFNRNLVWKTPITLWEDNVKKAPNKSRTNFQLGRAYLELADKEESKQESLAKALEYMERSVELDPDWAKARNNLGVLYARLDKFEKAVLQFEYIARLAPNNEGMQHNLKVTRNILTKSPEERKKEAENFNLAWHANLADFEDENSHLRIADILSSELRVQRKQITNNLGANWQADENTTYSYHFILNSRETLVMAPVSESGATLPATTFAVIDKTSRKEMQITSLIKSDGTLHAATLASLKKKISS